MKKLVVFLLCLMAVFAIVSCKQDPKPADEPAPVVEDGGVLTVKPASAEVTWGNTDRFQFLINQEFADGDKVEFLLKLSDSFEKIVPRSGNESLSWPKFATLALNTLEKDDDGWYIVSVTANDEYEQLGITAMLTGGAVQDENLFVSIKNLKIGGKLIDFATYDEETCVAPLVACPSEVTATIEK